MYSTSGGNGFLIREPFTRLPLSVPDFSSFESLFVTLKLLRLKLSVFNIYRPSRHPCSLTFFCFSRWSYFLHFSAATILQEFVITSDFNIHLDNASDNPYLSISHAPFFLPLNLTRKLFNQRKKSHSGIGHNLFWHFSCPISLHSYFSIISLSCFTKLSIEPTPSIPPTFHSFRRLHSIDTNSFLDDLKSFPLTTNTPESSGSLLIAYNTTLSSLFDKHAPIYH